MAKAVYVNVNPDVIKHYVEDSKIEIKELKKTRPFKNLEEWMNGKKKPTFNQIQKLAKKLRIPYTYLLVSEPIEEEIPLLNYRTMDSEYMEKPSRDLIDTIKNVERKHEFSVEYKMESGFEPLSYVGEISLNQSIKEITDYTRELLNIPVYWQKEARRNRSLQEGSMEFNYFREKIQSIGTYVFVRGYVGRNTHRSLNPDEFRAFVFVNDFAPTIFINTQDSKNGQLFSLIHEFVHVLLGEPELFNQTDNRIHQQTRSQEVEKICNAVTAEILVPTQTFKERWKTTKSTTLYSKAQQLSDYFRVSKTVIVRKALDNEFIEKNDYYAIARKNQEEFRKWKEEQKKKDSRPGYYSVMNHYMDANFYQEVHSTYYEGNLDYTETMNILGIKNRKGFKELEKRIIGG